MKYLSKAIKFIGIIFLLVLIYCTIHIFTSLELKEKIFKTFIELELIEEQDIFWTSEEYRKRLGVEIVALPPEEEQKFHLMIEKVINAGFRYYDTGEEKEFEVVRDFFLPEEYERVKEKIESVKASDSKIFQNYYKIPTETAKLEFSQPRKYRDLENRIGIISSIVDKPKDYYCKYGIKGQICPKEPFYIFLFQKIDNEWKIERMKDFSTLLKLDYEIQKSEQNLIQALLTEVIESPLKEEQNFHLMIGQTLKSAYRYYMTGEIKELEMTKNLFLSEKEYKSIKARIDHNRKSCGIETKCKMPFGIPLEFSQPMKDKNLKNRIGIMCLLSIEVPDFIFSFNCPQCESNQYYTFIFKRTDEEWRIEKMNWHYSPLKSHPDDILSENNPFYYLFREIKKEDSRK